MRIKQITRRNAPSSLPSTDAVISFENKAQRERYEKLKLSEFRGTRCVDWDFYEEIGLKESFRKLLEACSLEFLSDLKEDTYHHLTLEFLSSVNLEKASNWVALSFRLKGEKYFLTPEQIGSYFALSHIGYPVNENNIPKHEFWSYLIGRKENFICKGARASQIIEPLDKILHEFLTFTLNCRGSSNHIVQKKDLFLMWCIKEGIAINAAFWLMNRFCQISRKNSGIISIGGYVTHIAKCLNVKLDENDEPYRIRFSKRYDYIGSRASEGRGMIENFRGNWQPIQEEQCLPLATFTPLKRKRDQAETSCNASESDPFMAQIMDTLQQLNENVQQLNENVQQLNTRIESLERKVDTNISFRQSSSASGKPPLRVSTFSSLIS